MEPQLLRNYFNTRVGKSTRINPYITIRRYRGMLEDIRRKMTIEAGQKNIGRAVSSG
jgi:hypothetical protein